MARKSEKSAPVETITAFKGFDKDLKCRGFQYEVGKTYMHEGKVDACSSGFHACLNPLDVLNYYPLIGDDGELSSFATVELSGETSTDGGKDSKIASATISITAEIKLPKLIESAIKWVTDACKTEEKASGYSSKLAASGDYSQLAASGDSSQLAASGYYSQLAASGYSSKLAASGYYSQLAASGYYSQLAASGYSSKLAASGDSSQLAASGYSSQLAASGYSSKLAASGDSSKLAASGKSSIAVASAPNCTAMAGELGCIALTRWVESEKRYRVSVGYVGENGIKPNVFYELNENGEFVEVA